jgi:hypothetical protein
VQQPDPGATDGTPAVMAAPPKAPPLQGVSVESGKELAMAVEDSDVTNWNKNNNVSAKVDTHIMISQGHDMIIDMASMLALNSTVPPRRESSMHDVVQTKWVHFVTFRY